MYKLTEQLEWPQVPNLVNHTLSHNTFSLWFTVPLNSVSMKATLQMQTSANYTVLPQISLGNKALVSFLPTTLSHYFL